MHQKPANTNFRACGRFRFQQCCIKSFWIVNETELSLRSECFHQCRIVNISGSETGNELDLWNRDVASVIGSGFLYPTAFIACVPLNVANIPHGNSVAS